MAFDIKYLVFDLRSLGWFIIFLKKKKWLVEMIEVPCYSMPQCFVAPFVEV